MAFVYFDMALIEYEKYKTIYKNVFDFYIAKLLAYFEDPFCMRKNTKLNVRVVYYNLKNIFHQQTIF